MAMADLSKPPRRQVVMALRVATYNIHKGRGMDGRVRPDRVLEVLKEFRANIIALQEVLSFTEAEGERDQAHYFARELGMRVCIGQTRKIKGGIYGNVLLTNLRVKKKENYDISVRWREQRGCLRVDVEFAKHTLHIFNVHLGTMFYERRSQVRQLLREEILQNPELTNYRIVMGDFNEWNPGFVTRLMERHFGRATPLRTFPVFRPVLMLDHIYFDQIFHAKSISVHRSPLSLRASDHLPVIAELELRA
jgi:endonuclease/exonuclease/phosphatase family metal-dependent hydrolase